MRSSMSVSIERFVIVGCVAAMFLFDLHLVSEADAVFGTRRRTAMVTAAVVHNSDEQKSQQQQTQQQPATTEQPAATSPPPADAQGALPIGTIVQSLPPNCPENTIKGVAYYQCGGNSYRAAFQGSTLVYVTAQP